MSETVERLLINKKTGELGIGIRVAFLDKYFSQELSKIEGYSISVMPSESDGWIIFANDKNGAWLYVNNESVNDRVEDLGEL